MSTQQTAAAYKANMDALRHGQITADQFRSRNRDLRAQAGDAQHEHAKLLAVAASNR